MLQKRLAQELTCMVHSNADYEFALQASGILFGENTAEQLKALTESQLLDIMDGVPRFEINSSQLDNGYNIVSLLADTGILPSKGEARKMVQSNGISINKQKVSSIDKMVDQGDTLNHKYILIQKGKKNYYLITLG